MGSLWQAILNLIAGLLNTIYSFIGNYGISIIIFTVIMRLVMFPLSVSQRRNMEKQKAFQPKLNELKKKYKNDNQKMQEKQMELMREHGINPAGGCLPILIQFPIIIALFTVLRRAAEFVPKEALDQSFLWLPNMVDPDTLSNLIPGVEIFKTLPGLLPIIAAIFTYLTMSQTTRNQQATQDPNGPKMPSMGFMMYIFPVMILSFGTRYAAGLILYWAVSNILQFIQERVLTNMFKREDVVK